MDHIKLYDRITNAANAIEAAIKMIEYGIDRIESYANAFNTPIGLDTDVLYYCGSNVIESNLEELMSCVETMYKAFGNTLQSTTVSNQSDEAEL